MLTYDHLGHVTWISNSKHIWPVTISSTMGLPSKLINPTSHHQAMVILEEDTRGWLWNPGLVDSYSRLCGLYPTHKKNMCSWKNWILSFLQGSVGTDSKNLVENHHLDLDFLCYHTLSIVHRRHGPGVCTMMKFGRDHGNFAFQARFTFPVK